jgi:hypothetical protein
VSSSARDLEQLRSAGDALSDAVADAGTQLALSVDPDWTDRAWSALLELARARRPFTADDVAAAVGPAPSPGASGALFRAGARSGLIVRVGYGASRRLSRHGGLIRVWQDADAASGRAT